MKLRIHNNDGSDFADYEADTIDEIKEQCKYRISSDSWKNGWSEVLER